MISYISFLERKIHSLTNRRLKKEVKSLKMKDLECNNHSKTLKPIKAMMEIQIRIDLPVMHSSTTKLLELLYKGQVRRSKLYTMRSVISKKN